MDITETATIPSILPLLTTIFLYFIVNYSEIQ